LQPKAPIEFHRGKRLGKFYPRSNPYDCSLGFPPPSLAVFYFYVGLYFQHGIKLGRTNNTPICRFPDKSYGKLEAHDVELLLASIVIFAKVMG